ncbi:glycoside hydrolase family 130 protein [Arundinibacter roseus]|uniref:Glycosidase n=1 Tax=Arundinibacter roseus TaxID=2070510 RepID=A0A4R4K8K6_9BACT|nr:glycoside hydrolase family 130 protein [Arundinibacter roseus]TDB63773.1 glycosidase [Arundinibacter roseus]
MIKKLFLLAALTFTALCGQAQSWLIGPFSKHNAANPVLSPLGTTTFDCPVRGENVHWEAKDVFNPAAVVRNGKIHLLYRAEDTVGKHNGTSRIGLAISSDGLNFKRMPTPIFYPDNDAMKKYEWEGGVEDPRVVETADGQYVMTYTSYDGEKARLCVATSPDLLSWKKHGRVFSNFIKGGGTDFWSKSGSIVCRRVGSKLIATQINGKYWMYWGDQQQLFIAVSDDLIHWYPFTKPDKSLKAVAEFRPGHFDYRVLEPGPPALITPKGIVLIYNGMNDAKRGDTTLPEGTYAAGQFLFSDREPDRLLDRSKSYFMKPDQPYEINGQVNQVTFVESLVPFKGRWWLYYGTADSKIAVASAPLR